MALVRIRTVKPDFFIHDGLFDAEKETGLPLRIAYCGLWCACDREGRFKWEPRRLGVSILPYDGIDFSRVLDALLTRGWLVKYRVGDAWFGAVPSWGKHQFVNPREAKSEIPDITVADEVDASVTREPRDNDASRKERKGKEGKGKEGLEPPTAPRARNELLDALCLHAELTNPLTAQDSLWGKLAAALKIIKTATPDVTPAEIHRRTVNYGTHFRDASISSTALANNWGRCETAKESIADSTKGRAGWV